MLLSIPPSLSVSRAVQYLKGRSSHKLLAEFASLRKRYWGQHLWARGYWVASSGNVTEHNQDMADRGSQRFEVGRPEENKSGIDDRKDNLVASGTWPHKERTPAPDWTISQKRHRCRAWFQPSRSDQWRRTSSDMLTGLLGPRPSGHS
jgi:Transposase IS200 like